MQIKSVLLLLVIGAVVVLAKKESGEEKNGYETLNVWSYPRFGHKLGHGFNQGKQWAQNPVFAANRPFDAPQQQPMITSEQLGNFLENIAREMQKVSMIAYNEFQMVESQIDRNMKNLESSLFSQLQIIESLMASKEAREIKQAVKQGEDEEEIKNCLKEEEADFKIEMKGDVDRTINCINDATQRAKKDISDARNAYTENSVIASMQYKNWAAQLGACVYKNDVYCSQQMISTITEKSRGIIEEGNRQVKKLEDTPRQQMIRLDYCQENFLQDMKGMRLEYTNLIKECVSNTSAKKSEKEDSEGEEDSKGEEDSEEAEIGLKVQAQAKAN